MRLIKTILMMITGIGMMIPKALPWFRRLSERGKHYYQPDAHADILYGIGSFVVSEETVLTVLASVGIALFVLGIVGIGRAIRT